MKLHALVACAGLLALLLLGCGDEKRPSLIPHPVGYEGTLVDGPPITGWEEEAGLRSTPGATLEAPKHIVLAPGVRVKVIVAKVDGARVEVLDGMNKGKVAWVRWKDLR